MPFRLSRCFRQLPLLCAGLAGAALAAPVAQTAYPGTLSLAVDLRDTSHRLFQVQERIPATPGPLVLVYPKWVPGEHGPTGPLEGVTGLNITADGQPVPWRRDLEDMYALRVEVPPGAQALDLSFQYLSPGPGHNFGAGVSATPVMIFLEWNQVLFYPADAAARLVAIQPKVNLPADWSWASALELQHANGAELQFAPTTLETLVDSPLATGRYTKQIALSGEPAVRLDLFADRPADLALSEEQVRQHQRIVSEAEALFGAHHYAHYDFLFALSDLTDHFGLEHHQSSDDRIGAGYYIDPEAYLAGASLLTHEYVHSWNGKFRRPAGLLTPGYSQPMHGDLLWVYEGLTTYWGEVLAARAGFRSAEQFRDDLALTAAQMEFTTGRSWRTLQDTADAAQVLYGAPMAWSNWRRRTDFYPEGMLLWLDVDTLLREKSHGERSLDDFARAFYGMQNGATEPLPYTFDDVVAALDRVQHYDWAHFLRIRLDAKGPGAPLDGIVRGGWRLDYTEEPSRLNKAAEKIRKVVGLSTSLGIVVSTDEENAGQVLDVTWKSPAFAAGMAPGMKIVAVNGTRYDADLLKDAIKAARSAPEAIELLVQDADQFRSLRVDYHGGLRYAHLVRIENTDERLDAISKARAKP
jgi:predicted metalloprotease with PDZ domain